MLNDKRRMEITFMKEETKRMAERFSCEYQVFEKGGDPEDLEDAYFEALKEGKDKGFYPAILVVDEYVTEWFDGILEEDYDREKLISGCGNNGKELLEEYFRDNTEEDTGEEKREFIGNETEGDEIEHFCSYISFSANELEEDTLLLKIPVKHSWELIAWVPLGGWNDCPPPEDMIAVCKYWFEKYGAIPAVFTHDVMEFYAPNKLNGADSLEAAKEHYAFCPDRVFQSTSTNTLSEVAVCLEKSEVWYFWWD